MQFSNMQTMLTQQYDREEILMKHGKLMQSSLFPSDITRSVLQKQRECMYRCPERNFNISEIISTETFTQTLNALKSEHKFTALDLKRS